MQIARTLESGLCLLALSSAAIAHTDDPKGLEVIVPYAGPAYRAAEGGVSSVGFAAQGVILQSHLPGSEFGTGSPGSDCWGYTSPSGREYAIMTFADTFGWVDITDPANAQIVHTYSSSFASTWRDVKVYQHYAYVVSEGGDGIQIFDMENIDSGVVTFLGNVTTGGSSTHNVVINEDSGYLYRTGGSAFGIAAYDLNADPTNPTLVAEWPNRYVHDAQVVTMTTGPWMGQEIAFLCADDTSSGGNPGLDILNVTDKGNIQVITSYLYPQGWFSHQAWLSEDRQYIYLNDELNEQNLGLTSRMHVLDVSNLNAPFEVTAFTNGLDAVTHNLYVKGDFVFAANYQSGMRVYDITNRTAPAEVGFFDTYPANDGIGFGGLWSTFPFFTNNKVIGSDRQMGLLVWYIGGADIEFSYPGGLPTQLDPSGGSLQANISSAASGLSIVPKLVYDAGGGPVEVAMNSLGGDLYEASFPALSCPGDVSFYITAEVDNAYVVRDPPGAPAATYQASIASSITDTFVEDFELDNGWTVENSVELTDGAWERGTPVGGGDRGDPATDSDGSGQCFLTDNVDGNSDVDGGTTTLTSPTLDATGGTGIATLSYARWYSNNVGGAPNADEMPVEISDDDGATWVLLENVTENANAWVTKQWQIDQFVTLTNQIRVRFTAGDLGEGSVVEAGVDDVRIRFVECNAPAIPADVNNDGVVDVQDLLEVILQWGPCPPPCDADIDDNGVVDVLDLLEVILQWS